MYNYTRTKLRALPPHPHIHTSNSHTSNSQTDTKSLAAPPQTHCFLSLCLSLFLSLLVFLSLFLTHTHTRTHIEIQAGGSIVLPTHRCHPSVCTFTSCSIYANAANQTCTSSAVSIHVPSPSPLLSQHTYSDNPVRVSHVSFKTWKIRTRYPSFGHPV